VNTWAILELCRGVVLRGGGDVGALCRHVGVAVPPPFPLSAPATPSACCRCTLEPPHRELCVFVCPPSLTARPRLLWGCAGGCGSWPLYVGNGIIDWYEEDEELGLPRGLTWLLQHYPNTFGGLLTDHQVRVCRRSCGPCRPSAAPQCGPVGAGAAAARRALCDSFAIPAGCPVCPFAAPLAACGACACLACLRDLCVFPL
jgi:hypothetical protein